MVEFRQPRALAEALALLGPQTALIGGGTDLLGRPSWLEGKRLLVDLTRVAELLGVSQDEEGALIIGAAVTHQEISTHPLVIQHARLLALACARVGSIQIRHRGTLGGNLGNGSPAADSLPALACLEAEVRLAAAEGPRRVPVLSLLASPGQTVLTSGELIESVRIPLRKGARAVFFEKAGQRKGMCCSKASVAFSARRRSDKTFADVRLAMGAVAPNVIRVLQAERLLEGQPLEPRRIAEMAQACVRAARPIDDIRSSAAYRTHVVGALLQEGLLGLLDQGARPSKASGSRQR